MYGTIYILFLWLVLLSIDFCIAIFHWLNQNLVFSFCDDLFLYRAFNFWICRFFNGYIHLIWCFYYKWINSFNSFWSTCGISDVYCLNTTRTYVRYLVNIIAFCSLFLAQLPSFPLIGGRRCLGLLSSSLLSTTNNLSPQWPINSLDITVWLGFSNEVV